ncbi:hypothetical protein LguiA_026508 [Lonicera macranthoides]
MPHLPKGGDNLKITVDGDLIKPRLEAKTQACLPARASASNREEAATFLATPSKLKLRKSHQSTGKQQHLYSNLKLGFTWYP